VALINPDLLNRLASKLGVTKSRVYARVEQVANRTYLDRRLAALVLATESGVSIQKYSTAEERAEIRASVNGPRPVTSSPAPAATAVIATRRATSKSGRPKLQKAKDNSVFVVHGRDEGLRRAMFQFLRDIGLKPLEWSKAVLLPKQGGANPHIDDVLDEAMERVEAVVVLFSPDDLAYLRPSLLSKGEKNTEGKPKGQPRPNVIFEAGLALGRHPGKTLLVQVGSIRAFSDIAGKHLVRLTDDVAKKKDVAARLGKIGCEVDLGGDDWIRPHGLTPKP
jgi:predicted nucleotide-binding protein